MDNAVNIQDRGFMSVALQLAGRGLYSTQPNPRVGCVIVKAGEIIAEGWHQIAGEAHAEVNALKQAGAAAMGATAYVTLEPCFHTGRTGPCCKALVAAGIARVVVAMEDPNPLVSGQGVAYLRNNQVAVTVPLMAEQAAQLNLGFIKRQTSNRPFVRLKLAMSLDGRTALANRQSKWITGPAARADVQKLRARSCAIVTGIGTVLADDPALTIRQEQLAVADLSLALKKQPLRVILDSQLRIPVNAKVLQPAQQALVIYSEKATVDKDRHDELLAMGVEVVRLPGADETGIDLDQVMGLLAERECNEVLIESGAGLAGAMINSGLLDELVIYVSAKFLGHSGLPLLKLPEFTAMEQITQLKFQDIRHLGEDLKITTVFNQVS